MKLIVRLVSMALTIWSASATPRFSTVFQSHMVLQRKAPLKIWGFGAASAGHLSLSVTVGKLESAAKITEPGGDRWEATFPAQEASDPSNGLKVVLLQAGQPVQTLVDVCFGDVFLFTGQSNIDISSSYAHQFNETAQELEEAYADSVGSSGVTRIMIVPNQVRGLHYNSTTPARELASVPDCPPCPPSFADGRFHNCQCNAMKWTRPTNTSVRGFSATAWFTGKAIRDSIFAVDGVAIGLVRSSWGGTPIQSWSSPDAVAKCPQSRQEATGSLFNGMIAPFVGLQWSAVTWYQGESNTGADSPFVGPEYYSCALPALIRDWRDKMGVPSLPFVVVELSAYCNERDTRTYKTWCDLPPKIDHVDTHLPSMRLAQSSAEALPKVYIASAMDLGSLHPLAGSIHSDKKVILGQRIALSIGSSVYEYDKLVWRGPRPTAATMGPPGSITVTFEVTPGVSSISFNSSAACPPQMVAASPQGVYCTGGGFEAKINGNWTLLKADIAKSPPNSVQLSLPKGSSDHPVGDTPRVVERVRYAYADWPVVMVRNKDAMALPARLFDIPVTQ